MEKLSFASKVKWYMVFICQLYIDGESRVYGFLFLMGDIIVACTY